ncbi:uncharacterized protein LOC115921652 [Strongylocentrotus purpuratus]|uniref:Monocarboxylate transporter n=1 Tax=Strongylocentrotus purpuratus TaxID=7668 RepID=A0A7M7NDY6_STRPU|nr:uncharacterized protein LOC115921652 [Strongylocentrotus purpuratus]
MDARRCRAYLAERWGWVVTFASFCVHFVCFGIYYCFSITFIALQEEFETSSTATSWVGSIPIGLSTMAGVFVTPLIYRFSNRSIALVGIVLCFTSCMVTSLITVFPAIYLTYSVLYGVGSACASLASTDLLLRYFPVTNCARATMFALIGSSAGMLCLGPLTYTLIERWGWRIMLRVVGSILLVVGVAAIFAFHPPPPPPTTSGPDEDDTKEGKRGDQDVSPQDGTRKGSEIPDDRTNARVQPKYARLFNEVKTDQNPNAEDDSASKHAECEKTSEEMKPFLQEQIAEGVIGKEVCASLDRCDSDIAVALTASESTLPDGAVGETGEEDEVPVTFWTKHRSVFYPDVWVLGLCIMGLGVMNSFFYINMGSFLLSKGFEKRVLPWVVTTLGVSEMAGKLLLGATADRLPFPKIFLFIFCTVTGIGCMICLLYVRSVILLLLLSVVIGLVVMTIADVLSYSICNQVFRKEDAVQTWTVVMMLQGVGFMVGAVFGESIDKTGSYNEAIYTSMGMYAVCAVLCIAVPLYQKLFARHRFVMFDHQAKCRRLKTATATTTVAEVKTASPSN